MDKKLKALLGYVRGLNRNIDFTIQFYNDGDAIDYIDFTCAKNPGFNMSSNMEQIFYNIVELYAEDLYDAGLGSYGEGSDYFTVDGTIYSDRLVFESTDFTQYGTEDSGIYYDRDEDGGSVSQYFEEFDKFLDKEGVDSLQITYNGDGDSGYIDDSYSSGKKSGKITREIENICYMLLEDFGGWEINEGSQGTIEVTRDHIEIMHEWNTNDDVHETLNIVVTPDNLKQEDEQ
jgi:hypothetical protein